MVRWHQVPTTFRKMVGLAFLMAGLAAVAASSVCGSGASCAGDAGLRSPSALQVRLMQQPRSHGGTESEAHGQRKSRPPSRGQSGKGVGREQRQRAFQGFGGACRDAS